MAKNTETLRIGVPVRALKLEALLATLEPSDDAIVRYYNGQLIVEEPAPTLDGVDGDGDKAGD
jgi:hypothetical protein